MVEGLAYAHGVAYYVPSDRAKESRVKLLDAIHTILSEAAQPLGSREILERITSRKLWSTVGKTPENTILSQLGKEIRQQGTSSRFRRVDRGLYAVNEDRRRSSMQGRRPESERTPASEQPTMSFLDAAEYILRQEGSGAMLHYQEITKRALSADLIHTEGKTPDLTLNSAVSTDMRRREDRGEAPRFVRSKGGMLGLAQVPDDVRHLIDKRNSEVRARLLERAKEAPADHFEELIANLLNAIGFADVERTPLGGDGGIDVRGTLVIGDVVSVRMAVQAKRWQANVSAPTVQQVRGSLGAHEQGLIITTSDFSKGAQIEAQRADAAPVALMNGEQLATLLARYEMGAQRDQQVLLTLDPE